MFCRQDSDCLAEARLRLYILLTPIVYISRFHKDSRFLQTRLRGFLYRQSVLRQCLSRIAGGKVDIAHRAVDII